MNHRVLTGGFHARVALGCLAIIGSAAARADELPTVTPYRPSVSTPAALPAPGWLEIELGLVSSRAADPLHRDSLPYTLKLAFSPDWGVRIGGDAVVRQRDADGSTMRGGGDTSIVLSRRLAMSDASAFGVELGASFPTARAGIGSGHTDVSLNGIYSSDFAEAWHVDINLSATRLGGVDPATSAWRNGWATAMTRSLSDKWNVIGELSGTRQGGVASTSQALVAASFSVSRAMTLDFGVSKGLNSASGGWSVFSGVTFLAAHLF